LSNRPFERSTTARPGFGGEPLCLLSTLPESRNPGRIRWTDVELFGGGFDAAVCTPLTLQTTEIASGRQNRQG
jgi:hypothetical protein